MKWTASTERMARLIASGALSAPARRRVTISAEAVASIVLLVTVFALCVLALNRIMEGWQ